MNRPLRKVAVACLLLFGVLLAQANWVQVVKARTYQDDPRNGRVLLRTYDRERGAIAIGNGKARRALATSTETTDRLRFLRRYPGGPSYAHVTGFSSLVYGATGIEKAKDRVLSGQDDRLLVSRLSDEVTGRRPAGGSVLLTLQAAAQKAAYSGLAGKTGAVVALDPRTGAILALASRPSYDPDRLSSHDPAAIRKAYAQLSADRSAPLLDRALNATYPPGSTFKVITAAAALTTGRYTPASLLDSPTELTLPQTSRTLKNFGGERCGDGRRTTLADALRISCNTAFAKLGLDLGPDVVRRQAQAFGIGDDRLEVPLPVATSRYPKDPTPPQVAQSAIGQFDVQVTPLQMAMVAAGVAERGTVRRPYLVAEAQAPDLRRLEATEPTDYRRAVSGAVADQLRTMMELVVEQGTGTAARIPGVRVAGKTGTAQHAVGKPPHAWFIGFAPAQDPRVAVAVLVENGGSIGSEATGGRVAAPIARDVMRAVLGR